MAQNYPQDFFVIPKWIPIFAGLRQPTKTDSIIMKISTVAFNTIILLYCNIIYFLCEVLVLNVTIFHVATLLKHAGMLLTHLAGNLKLLLLYFKHNELIQLMTILNSDEYKYESYEPTYKPGEIFSADREISKRVNRIFLVLCTGVGTLGLIVSMPKISGHFQEGDRCESEYLPYYSYAPFSTDTMLKCQLSLVFQSIPMIIYGWQIFTHDVLFAGLLNCIKSHLNIVSGALRTIRKRSLIQLGLPINVNGFNDKDVPGLQLVMENELRKCSNHLQMIFFVCQKMEKIFSYITLVQTLASLFVIASCLHRTVHISALSGEFAQVAYYFLAIMVQLTLYCWFGNEITVASNSVNSALFEASWLGADKKFKSRMLIMMSRMQKPIYLSIGKFTPLTLATILSISRAAFSYFTVVDKQSRKTHVI